MKITADFSIVDETIEVDNIHIFTDLTPTSLEALDIATDVRNYMDYTTVTQYDSRESGTWELEYTKETQVDGTTVTNLTPTIQTISSY